MGPPWWWAPAQLPWPLLPQCRGDVGAMERWLRCCHCGGGLSWTGCCPWPPSGAWGWWEPDCAHLGRAPQSFPVRSLGWVEMSEEELAPGRSSVAVNNCIRQLSLHQHGAPGAWGGVSASLPKHSITPGPQHIPSLPCMPCSVPAPLTPGCPWPDTAPPGPGHAAAPAEPDAEAGGPAGPDPAARTARGQHPCLGRGA